MYFVRILLIKSNHQSIFSSPPQHYREKKREREREELWKRLHELENTKMQKNASNNEISQNPANSSSSIGNTNPNTATSTTASNSANTINSIGNTINASGGDPYKKEGTE